MVFTVKELLQAGNHHWEESEVDAVTLRNLEDLCRKINALGYVPAMYGSAFRWYLMADYKFKFGLTMALRVAQTAYSDRDAIGSSHDLIRSNHRTDVHIVLSYKIKTDKNRWN